MARKKWTPKTSVTPSIVRLREKKKWQIALRRYVVEKSPSSFYAPYFGIDIENFRHWLELQFENGLTWADFAVKWQLQHILPAAYFDFSNETDLRLCWNYLNIRVQVISDSREAEAPGQDIYAIRSYFETLHTKTRLSLCLRFIEKIDPLISETAFKTTSRETYILQNRDYLEEVALLSSQELELLNNGRTLDQVKKEMEILRKYGQ